MGTFMILVLMESAIYGVLDLMIKVLLEMAMLVRVMNVMMMHLAHTQALMQSPWC